MQIGTYLILLFLVSTILELFNNLENDIWRTGRTIKMK